MMRFHLSAGKRLLLAVIPFVYLLGSAAYIPIQAQSIPAGISPDVVRQRIHASGLSPDQIRARLRLAGYRPDLLDPYMGQGPLPDTTPPDADLAAGLSILNAHDIHSDGIEPANEPINSTAPETDDPDKPFGLDVFQRATTQFQPLLAGPVPPTYRLGPGDVLVLVLTGDVEVIHTLEVTRDGFIVIPQVGQIFVNTLTLEQLRRVLRERLERIYSGLKGGEAATTHFDLTVAKLRTIQVSVIGEVAQPGSYQLSSVATVLNALYVAGGPTERGNFRRVEIRRQGELLTSFDLYDYLLHGDTRSDLILEQGDIIFVPVHGTRAVVRGEVVRPATYELKPGETLADLIEAAGGFTPMAALDRVSISRIVPPEERRPGDPSRIVVDVSLHGDRKAVPFPIEPGDEVTVFRLPSARRAVVELKGNVYSPGAYGWTPDLTLSKLIRLAGGFRPATYAGRAHIERLNPADSTRYLVHNVQLPATADEPFPNDVQLQDYDIVTIYGRDEFRSERWVTITGMVNEPGSFPYREGMTLRDLVLMARGLRDGAYLDSAEIARLPSSRGHGQLAIRLRVPLDSSYLFEGDSSSYRFLPGMLIPERVAPEFELEPFDHVTILQQPEFEFQRMIKITGEVRFPGTYALSRKDERLSEIILRAGGLLPTGYAPGATLYRKYNHTGMIDIDLERILNRPGTHSDLVLMPEDSIHIPEYNPIVRVIGEVNSPVSVQYKPGAGLDYYIANAGGYTRDADKSRVSVRYANGSADVTSRTLLMFRSKPTPLPGSTVIVPAMRPEDRTDWKSILSNIAQVTGTLGTLAAIVLTR